VRAYREDGFPATIVRPYHTYDRTAVPSYPGSTLVQRMRQGKEVVVHGDGTARTTLTHSDDFAKGFVPLLGSSRTIGEAFHITSDDVLTWNQITMILATAGGTEPKIVHVPSDVIAAADPHWGATLLGNSAHSMIFDKSKMRSVVPDYVATISFEQAAPEIIAWHDQDPARQRMDADLDALMDKLPFPRQGIARAECDGRFDGCAAKRPLRGPIAGAF
jgi:nucleoside-diphosphate-sugar epimerase